MTAYAFENIPDGLCELPNWLVWRLRERNGKPTKVPYRPAGGYAKSNEPATWGTFDEAVAALARGKYTGVGFVFTGTKYVGVDLDHCRDPETGALTEAARRIVDAFDTYTEESFSGTGVHLILGGRLPEGSRNRRVVDGLEIEVYDEGRYFAMTGRTIGEHALRDCQAELEQLSEQITDRKPEPRAQKPVCTQTDSAPSLSDVELLDRMFAAANGKQVRALWDGDISAYPSHSEADLALCNALAFWGDGDEEFVARMYRVSGLYRPKWERADYRTDTIATACESVRAAGGGYKGRAGDPKDDVDWAQIFERQGAPKPAPYTGPQPPTPLCEAAYHGPLGAFVRAWEGNTEADPAAVLLTSLVAFSSVIGNGPRLTVSGQPQRALLWVGIAGSSAVARKGHSLAPPLNLMGAVDPVWRDRCVASGLSSGEGLIYRVRDCVKGVRDKDGATEEYVVDAGVSDKRLLLVEGEFARVLTAMGRRESTLSPILRGLWDSGDAGSMTRGTATKTTGSHVCLVTHVTLEELRRALADTDAANGFANRFLWVYATRHGSLPFGGEADRQEVERIRARLADAHLHAPDGEIGWSPEARARWEAEYEALLRDIPGGLTGSIIARGQPQVVRLAMIYALADDAVLIGLEHLEAALEVWRYCADSARFIFGDRSGDRLADRILNELRMMGPMTRSALRETLGHHKSRGEITGALALLEQSGLAQMTMVPGEKGRPAEVWSAC
jgi:hypothetical protein